MILVHLLVCDDGWLFGVVYIGLVGMEGGIYVNREHEKPLALLSPLNNPSSYFQFSAVYPL
jgi:hypothetical protein